MRYWRAMALLAMVACGTGAVIVKERLAIRLATSSYEGVRLGMTSDQVESVIGWPAGDYAGEILVHNHILSEGTEGQTSQGWLADGIAVIVHYGLDGRVVGKDIHSYVRQRNWLERLLGLWLG